MLVLGGTAEAAALAGALVQAGQPVVTSLAGATRDPAPLPGETRIGGFGGVEGLARYLDALGPVAVVDATHPFAERISANARRACARRVALLRLERPAWRPAAGDRWHPVADLAQAARALPALGRRVFLPVGLRELAPFAAVPDTWFLLRAVDPPERPVALRDHLLVLGRGPFRVEEELALLERHRVEAVVTRNAGGEGSRAKLVAARQLALPVVMVSRPAPAPGEHVEDVAGALEWLSRLPGGG